MGCLLALCIPLAASCRQIAPYARVEGDRGVTRPDAPVFDLGPPFDLALDSGPSFDLGPSFDSASDAYVPPVCGGPPGAAVARWTFDDLAAPSDGQVQVPFSVRGSVTTTAGGCGNAATFTGDASNYLEIADLPAWHLPQGSIELWARFDGETAGEPSTLLSRDAYGQVEGGHLVIAYRAGAIAARLQAPKSGSLEEEAYACAYPEPTVLGDLQWHHIVVSFGDGKDLEIYLDGKRGTFSGWALGWPCGTKPAALRNQGLDNQEPIVVGAGTTGSTPGGLLNKIDEPFFGAIDELRIHGVRIDY